MLPNFLPKFTEKNEKPDMCGIRMLIMGYLWTQFLFYFIFSTFLKNKGLVKNLVQQYFLLTNKLFTEGITFHERNLSYGRL